MTPGFRHRNAGRNFIPATAQVSMSFDMYVLLRERNLDVMGVESVVDALEHVADDV